MAFGGSLPSFQTWKLYNATVADQGSASFEAHKRTIIFSIYFPGLLIFSLLQDFLHKNFFILMQLMPVKVVRYLIGWRVMMAGMKAVCTPVILE